MGLSKDEVRAKIDSRKPVVTPDSATFDSLLEEAQWCHKAEQYNKAADKCIDAVACLEKNTEQTGEEIDALMHVTVLHNLASALHQMGHLSAAKDLYEDAHRKLSTAPRGLLDCCLGDRRPQMLDFIKARIALVVQGGAPGQNRRTYLDEKGTEQMWTDEEVKDAAEKAVAIEATGTITARAVKTPTLNLATASRDMSQDSWTTYQITDTPRKELW